ncbi:MAG: AI-2E family transporter [Gemmatimonadales bacterium]|nr:MAG: AI-2E family transporter [Gemmatimonadales bacterium]
MSEKIIWGPGARFLFLAASAVVVVAGLRAAAPILLPFSLALFLAILSLPIMFALKRKGVPTSIAILIAVLIDLAIFGVLVLLVTQSVADFQERLPQYVRRFQNLYAAWIDNLQDRGIPAGEFLSTELISVSAILDFAGGTLTRIASFLSNAFLVILVMVFILAEAVVFPQKFRAVLGQGDTQDVSRFAKITGEVQEYLVIKTLVSVATGLSIGLWAWIMGLDFPILLGLIGFVLNYVPTIGSILAAIPAMLLALIQTGSLGLVAVVAVGYGGINLVFGNLIEPQLLGRRLGLSTLVVILSLLFWAWVWGPVGALLAVPLTMVVKIGLENTQDLRWIALLLDKEPPPQAEAAGPASIDTDEGV